MSIQENYLKEIADAIREKDGTTGSILAKEFPEKIRAIETGGGDNFAVPLRVNAINDSIVYAKKGDVILLQQTNAFGIAELVISDGGRWEIYAIKGEAKSESVFIDIPYEYSALIVFANGSLIKVNSDLALNGNSNVSEIIEGTYLLFNNTSSANKTTAIDKDLIKTMAPGFAAHASNGAYNNKYAIFGGSAEYNAYQNRYNFYNTKIAFDVNLVANTAPNQPWAGSCAIGSYFNGVAVFGGGNVASNVANYNVAGTNLICYYDDNLTVHSLSTLSFLCKEVCFSANFAYLIALGGINVNPAFSTETTMASINIYDSNFVKIKSSNTEGRKLIDTNGCALGGYNIFGGGTTDEGVTAVVFAYNEDLTLIENITPLIYPKKQTTWKSLDGFALCMGGENYINSASTYYNTIDAYDSELTKVECPNMNKYGYSSASGYQIGDYLIFGGGNSYSTPTYVSGETAITTTSLEIYKVQL